MAETTLQVENTFVVGEEIVNQLMSQNANILSILQEGNGGNAFDVGGTAATTADEESEIGHTTHLINPV